jgi:hypothetical protein
MDDEQEIARSAAAFYGFTPEQALEARRILALRHDDFALRFTDLVRFAKTYGVGLVDLATFIASGSGIEPFERNDDISSDEWQRIRDVQERLASGGDWAHTILALLDEAEGRGSKTRGNGYDG